MNQQQKSKIQNAYQNLMQGILQDFTPEYCTELSYLAVDLIEKKEISTFDLEIMDLLLRIGNITYNNTTLDVLPLDDGVYDKLSVKYKKYNPNYQVGAPPIQFQEQPQNEIEELKIMAIGVSNQEMDSKLYAKDILQQHTNQYQFLKTMAIVDHGPIKKRLINTQHVYPELVGTLDKCKFTLNADAVAKGVYEDDSVHIFERDFIQKHLNQGIIQQNEIFEIVGELKYDGVSVEADICGDKIISARSRGDTNDDIATDLTPILGGYRFPNAKGMPTDVTFGIKFEAIITKYNLEKMAEARKKSYKNGRNAIIGLFSASDADHFIDCITLIPLATSLEMPRIKELEFLNKYYNSGQYNRFVVMQGDYKQILFQVKQFTESAELVRKSLPYMIDGVVLSYTDQNKIHALGRENSVNKYSMAIKFNPKKVRTIFTGYTFSIGKSGEVIPMVHFKPCEFIGTIHDKQTIHSYSRFVELSLRKGDEIDVEYRNEVITYITKPDTQHNRINKNPVEPFIQYCPYCGEPILLSKTGKSAYCGNDTNCPERNIMKMIDMVNRLGFVNFAEESVRDLSLESFSDLINISKRRCDILGPNDSESFYRQVQELKTKPIPDYRIMSALGFDNMADEKWKVILSHYTIQELIDMKASDLYQNLVSIKSIGQAVASSVVNGKHLYCEDLKVICTMPNIIQTKGSISSDKRVVFSGFRNTEFAELLNQNGFDADDSYSLTKNTYCLIVANKAEESSKVKKAKQYGIPIKTMQEFLTDEGIKV